MDDRMALVPGTTLRLGGMDCRIESVLGRGSNAVAYHAVYGDSIQPGQLHRVLIKELFPWRPEGGIFRDKDGSISCSREAEDCFSSHRESFLRGNKVHLDLQRTRSDKVPMNVNTFQANGTLYTMMGFSGGQTLQEVLDSGEPIPLKTLACWMRNLVFSLRVFHEHGLLHLDVSPDNILIQPLDSGKPEIARELLLIDYNSAWRQTELAGQEGLLLSLKEPYSAPELRLRDLNSVGPASDLYSIGVVFLTVLSGKPPQGIVRRIPPVGNAPALQGVSSTVFHQVLSILQRSLKAPPGQRYQSADEAIRDISELIERIDGGGVSRAALWEASCRRLRMEVKRLPVGAEIAEIAAAKEEALRRLEEGGSCCLTGASGAGKTSMLLSLCCRGTMRYDPGMPVPVYLPLYSYDGRENYLHRAIMNLLSFPPGEGWDAANHALEQLLRTPSGGGPAVRLLLDGADEAGGDLRPLLSEIRSLERTGGVQIITAARQMAAELGLPERPMPPLTEGEVDTYLEKHGLPRPERPELLGLLRTPIFLAMYRDICQHTGTVPEAADKNGLLDAYLGTLVSSHRETFGADAGFQAELAVHVLLPLLSARMNGRPRLSPDSAFRCVRECFSLLRRRCFFKVFPRYMGRGGILRGGAADAEAWFGLMVREILERHLSLLWQDDQGNYHLFHQYFQSQLAQQWRRSGRHLMRARAQSCLPAVVLLLVCMGALWSWSGHLRPDAYPRTAQEQQTAGTLVNQLALSCGLADFQYQAHREILEAADDELLQGDRDAWERWQAVKERKLSSVQLLDISSGLEQTLLAELAGTPVPLEAVEALFALPERLQQELPQRTAVLEACLAPGSPYPERDRRQTAALFEQLLESETAGTFLLMGKVISALDGETAAPLLDYLSHTVSWRQQLRQADWEDTDYDRGLTACRDEQRELREDLAALGLNLFEEDRP